MARNTKRKGRFKSTKQKFYSRVHAPKLARRKTVRQEKANKRKAMLPILVVSVFLWLVVIIIIFSIDPATKGIVQVFLIAVFAALFSTTSLLVAKKRQVVLVSMVIIVVLVFRYLGIGNLLNLVLLLGLAITTEIYTSKK